MENRKRWISAALAALLVSSTLPSALALDTTPPMYQQFGYDSAQDFEQSDEWEFNLFDYDAVSEQYRQHLEAIRKNPMLVADYWGYDSIDDLIEDGCWADLEKCYRETARSMAYDDEWESRRQLSVQLNGETISFSDAQPEKVNGRVMVPFRAIAEALGAEVSYDAGKITAKKNGQTLAFSVGGKQLIVTEDSTGKTVKTTELDAVPYKKGGRTYVPVRFFAESFGLTSQWDGYYQTAVLYDRQALVNEIDSEFSVLNQWLKIQRNKESAKTVRGIVTINAVYTAFDTIDGDTDYKVNAKLNILSNGKSTEATVTVDLRVLAEYICDELPEDIVTNNILLKTMLSNMTVDMICNAEDGSLYIRCPALAKVLVMEQPEDKDLKALANGAWLHIDGFDMLFGVGGSWEKFFGESVSDSGRTFGQIMVTAAEKYAENDDWDTFWQQVQEERESLAEIAADKRFTRNGTRYTAQFAVNSDGADTVTDGSYMLDVSDGSFSGKVESRSEEWGGKKLINCEFSGTAQNGKMKLTYHTKNTGILTLELAFTASESDSAPKSAPPVGDKIVELNNEVVTE